MTEGENNWDDRSSTESIQQALENAVGKTLELERRRQLGQYAVIIRNGRTVRLGIDVPWGQESEPKNERSPRG